MDTTLIQSSSALCVTLTKLRTPSSKLKVAAVAAGIAVVAITATYAYRKVRKQMRMKDDVEKTLDNLLEEQSMPMDNLSDGLMLPDVIRMPNMVSSNMDIENSPVAERRHRRLPHQRSSRERDVYVRTVVAELKVKLGTPVRKASNDAIIRRLARGLMEVHGLRPTHQSAIINQVIAMVYIPSDGEIEASELTNSWVARYRRWLVRTPHAN